MSSKKPRRECKNCKKECNKPTKKYCNIKCQQEYQTKTRINLWIEGTLKISTYSIRNYLLKKQEGKCFKCGWSEINPITNKIPLELEHIDGDWRNNSYKNVILLCPNCHSLTSTFRALNKRPADRKIKGQRKKWGNTSE